jgi:hypothetical protein
VLVPVVALAIFMAAGLGGTSYQQVADLTPQLRDMFTSALTAWETDGYGSPGTVENNVPPPLPTAAERAQQKEAGYADAEKYFDPNLAAQLKDRVDRSATIQEDPNQRVLGAGIKNLDIKSIRFDDSGSSATIVATYTHWANSAQLTPGTRRWSVFTPSNDVRVTVTMERQPSGDWVATDYLGEFINGTGP